MDYSPLSMEILQARILEWVACPPPGTLPDPGLSPHLLRPPTLAGGFFTTSATWEAPKALGLSAESFASETGCPLKGQNPAWD